MFDRPIGQNQGVQFPIAESYIELEAADLMRWEACELFDAAPAVRRRGQHGEVPRRQGVVGRRPTSACRRTAASASPAEYDVERKFRETRLYQVAPISTNLILSYVAEHVLGLPRSF